MVEIVDLCSPEDVQLRFAGGIRPLAADQAARLSQIDYDREMALIAEDARGRILGVARLFFDPEGESAEYALLVRSDRQKHGLGGRLFHAILDYAASRGAREVWGDVARDNGRMLELASALGFRRQEGLDSSRFRVVWTPPA